MTREEMRENGSPPRPFPGFPTPEAGQAYVDALVADWPPFTPEQFDALYVLLEPMRKRQAEIDRAEREQRGSAAA